MRSLFFAALMIAAPVFAQMPERPVQCLKQEIVPGFEAWGRKAGDTLVMGQPASLRLSAIGKARFAPPAARPLIAADDDSYSGAFRLRIEQAGTYRIALSAKAWIDVARDDKSRESVAHMPGPACSGITKIVDFALEAGDYSVRISKAAAPSIGAMVVEK